MGRISRSCLYALIALLALLSLPLILVEAGASPFQSDDFNGFNLDTGRWGFVDPVGDATLQMIGTNTPDAWVSISVPGGVSHNVWTAGNRAPRIMQSTDNTDFGIEIKFESGLSERYQMQGVLVEQDSDNFLRFDFHSDGSNTRIFAASFTNGVPLQKANSVITGTDVAPLYMRVRRVGNQWTQSYSYDGANWSTGASFSRTLVVTSVGAFVGNAGDRSDESDVPAYTGTIDYFFNTASPADPEDGTLAEDEAPPLIYNVQDRVAQTQLRVDWSTDEPATGTVRYGETTAYGLGARGHDDFSVHHSVLITDLQSDTTYNYRVVSQDSNGHAASSDNFVVETHPAGTLEAPVIDIWYGDNQRFGHIGNPQYYVNILGNVSDPDGVNSLVYSLNGGPDVMLSMGPDTRRLADPGDFNVDLLCADLVSGTNQVVIKATDKLTNQAVETVTVQYARGNVWPGSYVIDWSTAPGVQDVAQVVDGQWAIEGDSVRPTQIDYDRLVAIGDLEWTDYQVTVPITIHAVDVEGAGGASGGPGLGILMRWTGHTDSPISGWQPKTGWNPFGAIGWWRWSSSTSATLQFHQTAVSQSFLPDLAVPYMFKMRVESTPGQGGLYRLKVWRLGQPEPVAWNLTYQASATNLANGSFMLLAHHVDASFGDVTVVPGPFVDDAPPVISNIQAAPGETTATVTWTTDEPATSTVSYGQSAAYEGGSVHGSGLVTDHTIVLTGLAPGTLYHYRVASADENGYLARSADLTFTTVISDITPPVISDIQVVPGRTTARVTWTTDEPATSAVSYGRSTAYEDGSESDSALVIGHVVTLTNLISNTLYHYQVASVDGSGNPASSMDLVFTTTRTMDPSGIVSDDFNGCSLDTDLWTFVNPKADATYAMTKTFSQDAALSISVPAGTDHDIWASGNFAPRIMQPAQDEDFEIEVKFGSGLSKKYQMQGLLVEQDSDDFLRFEFYSDGVGTRLYAVVLEPGSPDPLKPTIKYNQQITGTGVVPLYMRVRREGNQWTQSYSFDGTSWTTPVTFTHALSVTAVGVYASNAGSNPPPHTGIVDYFFNTASPIVAEDGDRNALTVYEVGGGSVITEPAKASYSCGEVVTLTAQEDPGWRFAGWSGGGLSGTGETVTVTMTGSRVVTATFTQDQYALTVNIEGRGVVTVEPSPGPYHYGDVVTLTAQEDPGWRFAGWSGGGLSGTDETVTVTMTGDLVVTATFATHQVFLPLVASGYGR